jgi:AcrR family transcriptional regulator
VAEGNVVVRTTVERGATGVPPTTRPRIEGEREAQILDAALELLREVGYDRLTMDAVASAAHASKASLYRRWGSKARLVVDAVSAADAGFATRAPETGTLRGDLLAAACGAGGMLDQLPVQLMAGLVTALHHHPDLAAAFEESFLRPRLRAARALYERARDRGEVRADVDLDLVLDVLPGIVLHRVFLRGERPTQELITRVVDDVVLPAVRPAP